MYLLFDTDVCNNVWAVTAVPLPCNSVVTQTLLAGHFTGAEQKAVPTPERSQTHKIITYLHPLIPPSPPLFLQYPDNTVSLPDSQNIMPNK